ncbi:MAG: hypothetical protein ACI4CS_03960 [Candidatus Weimeria sp.]
MTREETITSLISRKKYLESIISLCKKKLESAPEGRVATSRSNGVDQFYFYNNCSTKRKYLNDKSLIEKLVSKDYHSKLLSCAESELHYISRFLEGISKTTVEEVFKLFPEAKSSFITPLCVDNETFAKQWAEADYDTLDLDTKEEYISNDGKRYRSKSELLIANALNDAGVPFKYECRLYLKGYGPIYPDFTVLNRRNGQVFYHEHLGMLESPEYLIKNLQKINAYEKNGIMQGKQLIMTFESEHVHLDLNIMNKIIKEFYL